MPIMFLVLLRLFDRFVLKNSRREAVLSSTCSALIALVENGGSKFVYFSHFSRVPNFRTSEVGNISIYHIPLDAAHPILARACPTVVLQLDETVDKKRLAAFPLAFYAAHHWADHAKFEGVALRVQDDMERLINPRNPYLAAWDWIYNLDRGYLRGSISALAEHAMPPDPTALYSTLRHYMDSVGWPSTLLFRRC
jgi:hypothetical protein